MIKAALDSDIYAGIVFLPLTVQLFDFFILLDIYGDEEIDLAEEALEKPELPQQEVISGEPEVDAQASSSSIEVYEPPTISNGTLNQDTYRSLPPKPTGPSGAQLSYSAQVAKQFSAYQQTPSQERQQQQNPRFTQGRPVSAPSEYKTVPGTSTDTVFGKKPSEMHDSG